MSFNFFGRYFRLTFLFVILAEIFSYCAYIYPSLNTVVFFVIIFLTLVLSLNKIEYGLYILLAELFISSKGYLFSLPFAGLDLSLRMGLFLIIMSVWLAKVILSLKTKNESLKFKDKLKEAIPFLKSKFFTFYFSLFIFLLWGLVFGLIRGNSFVDIFFDFNGWVYFLLIFPFYSAIKSREQIIKIFQVLFACLLFIGLKTIFLFYIFSHQMTSIMENLYFWTRRKGLGEITMLNLNFYRVFFQSQIYSLMGFFILLPIFVKKIIQREKDSFRFFDLPPHLNGIDSLIKRIYRMNSHIPFRCGGLLLFCSLPLLISFSRSFWVGLLFTVFALLFILKIYLKESWSLILKTSYCITAIFLVSAFLIVFMINFPKRGSLSAGFGSLIQKRVSNIGQESAGRSRMDLLPPLFETMIKHPVIGSGFGTTVTYKSSDPRVMEVNRDGWYTTYAFEWGYLDIWLKIGLAGLIIYLYLIWKIIKEGFAELKISNFKLQTDNTESRYLQAITYGMLMGLLALLVTNFFSPYLNHPLGIGYLLLCSVIFERAKEGLTQDNNI